MRLYKLISWPKFLVLCTVCFVYWSIFFFSPWPFSVASVKESAGGLGILDQRGYYTSEFLYQRLYDFGPTAREQYSRMLVADFGYICLYSAMFLVLGALFLRSVLQPGSPWRYVALVALVPGMLDVLENSLLLVVLAYYPHKITAAGIVGGVTLSKQVASLAGFMYLLITGVWAARVKLSRKK